MKKLTSDEQAFEAGALAMKAAIEAKLKAWQEWITRDGDNSPISQMTICAYAGARTVAQLTAIPKN